MKLITDQKIWKEDEFEAYIEGMCVQLEKFPYPRVAFWAYPVPETIFLFFAIWKLKKVACPLNIRLPSEKEILERLSTSLFIPRLIAPQKPKPWDWKEENIATLLLTSGSSGIPKVACHTIGNFLYSALGSLAVLPLETSDIWHLSLPLFHVGGIAILFRCYFARCGISLEKEIKNVTHLSLVPTQLLRYLREKVSLSHLKAILLGGAPQYKKYDEYLPLFPTYGMTEMSSQIITQGKILPFGEIKLSSEGEILVKGKTLFQGYLTPGQTLDLPLDGEGWFATKDVGAWNEKGELEILGRKDNLFISGGENIQPEEIELILKSLFCLEEVIVVPVPDEEFGAVPVLFSRPFIELENVKRGLSSLLPKYKHPKNTFVLSTGPYLKPSRAELKLLAINLLKI